MLHKTVVQKAWDEIHIFDRVSLATSLRLLDYIKDLERDLAEAEKNAVKPQEDFIDFGETRIVLLAD